MYTFPAPVSLSLLILAHLLADSESPMLCGHMIVSVRVFSVVADSVIARRAFLSLSKVCLCCRVLPFSSVTSFSFVERIPPALKSNLIQRMIRFKTTWSKKSDFSLWRSWDILFEIIKKAMILCLSQKFEIKWIIKVELILPKDYFSNDDSFEVIPVAGGPAVLISLRKGKNVVSYSPLILWTTKESEFYKGVLVEHNLWTNPSRSGTVFFFC